MHWMPLSFGKYRGLTLPQVMFRDPDWFFWACEKGIFSGSLVREARELNRKARKIRPNEDEVKIYCDSFPERFVAVDKQNRLRWRIFRGTVIDLSIPRRCYKYDKKGNREFLHDVKLHLFGSSSYKMTKRRCEAFFEDDSNFVLDEDYVSTLPKRQQWQLHQERRLKRARLRKFRETKHS